MATPSTGPKQFRGFKLRADIDAALFDRAKATNRSLTAVTEQALAEHLGVPYEAAQTALAVTAAVSGAVDLRDGETAPDVDLTTMARTTRGVPPADVETGIEYHRRARGVTRSAWALAGLRFALAHPDQVAGFLTPRLNPPAAAAPRYLEEEDHLDASA